MKYHELPLGPFSSVMNPETVWLKSQEGYTPLTPDALHGFVERAPWENMGWGSSGYFPVRITKVAYEV